MCIRDSAWSDDETVPMEKKMFRTPDTYGYFTLSYNPFVPMPIALSGTYTGSMLVEHKDVYKRQPYTCYYADCIQ